MPSRRRFLCYAAQAGTTLALLPRRVIAAPGPGSLVNDIHSQLNPTRVDRVVPVLTERALQSAIAAARADGKPVAISGGRHAMGGQQFATDAVLLDLRGMKDILQLDRERGIVEVEAGIQWSDLINGLLTMQQMRRLPGQSCRSRPVRTA